MQHGRSLWVFPVLSAIAFYYLWIEMLQNGTVDAMGKAVEQQQFPDGTALRTVYTNFAPVDHALSTLVAFTYYPTNGDDKETRFLYIDILSTLQTGVLWCLIEGLRSGRTSVLFAFPAVWGLVWNAFGAAVVLPIYALFHLQKPPHDYSIPPGSAKALIPALTIGSYLPSILAVAPPLVVREASSHQTVIGYFQLTALGVAVLHYIFSTILSPSASARPGADLPWIRGALGFAIAVSSMAHIYALAGAFLSSDVSRSIYFGVSSAQVSGANVDKIALGAAFFLQWDWAIINLCTIAWGTFLTREQVNANVMVLILALTAMNGLVGPGAMMSGLFYWREGMVRGGKAGRQGQTSKCL